ncbi:MAG: hypothetical protein AAFU54_30990 [Chloroflexota bacterium]
MPANSPTLHPTLIKANIALFKGERAEALRLLRQYETERPATDDPHRSMVLWLEAQTQTDDDLRIRLLHDLIATVDVDDTYAQMAREYLLAEETYRPDDPQRPHTGQRLAIGGGVAVLLAVLIGGGILLSNGSTQTDETPSPAPTTPADPTIDYAALPDRSDPLVEQSFTVRYDRGILQILALENDSVRVIDPGTGSILEPVAGARFYALEIAFECRSGICNTPPEAALTLRTGTGDLIPIREDAAIAASGALEPIALGRRTTGWLVFEIPSLSRAEALLVKPDELPDEADPFVVSLPQ